MQFSISKEIFLDGITKVQGIAGRKTTFPITANVLISAQGSTITMVATDLEIGFKGHYPATVEEEGTITIPGKKLFEIVREFPHGAIDVRDLENGWVQIFKDKVQYKIVGMDPNDFPKLPEVEGMELFELDSIVFADMIEKTNLSGGMSSEEKRPHLIGVYLEKIVQEEKNGLRMVSTDGNRLAMVDYVPEKGMQPPAFDGAKGVILPKKVMTEILRVSEGGGNVSLGVQKNYFVIQKEAETIIGRLVEGEYPDYNLVIPNDLETFFEIEKQPFVSILKRMSILCSERYRAVRFKVDPQRLEVSVNNPELGDSNEEMPIAFNGGAFEAAFNPRFFLDALNPMKSDMIKVNILDSSKPCILEGPEDPRYLSVIMPMRM
ncbi:DNA polymerase-3 subunit beta [Desulfatibacillum alkenivorans DSM 16219]|jgi:DNA polymerase-3 subunit beta|uniref:Beta sliding clamp n=1 Tax=Desulfatibacillum alkenivorans DSM 16219 TaxID=1121393 RepID=A0A1M6SE66_9BACT|nr:DNA polymerase III subunit beta [Desulfatibacillum alkenivorans]SHK42949.1 DNA polymerase-3 subunit beta [Desulfatibacillum alkenivorans DSM 16219]